MSYFESRKIIRAGLNHRGNPIFFIDGHIYYYSFAKTINGLPTFKKEISAIHLHTWTISKTNQFKLKTILMMEFV